MTTASTSTIISPHLRSLAESIASAPDQSERLLQDFWTVIQQEGTPLIEPSDTSNACLVTWLYRQTDREIASIEVIEPFSWKAREARHLSKLDGTDIWYISWHVRIDLRGSYGFLVTWVDGGEPWRGADPLARDYEGDGWEEEGRTSVIVMPQAASLTWRHADPSVPRGTIHEHTFHSDTLGNKRAILVHTPAGYEKSAGPYPFVVIFDGEEPGHPAPDVIDNLIAAGMIPPLVAILVDQIEIRDQELPGNPHFSRAIATELVPWLHTEYKLSNDPRDAILNGGSYGGFCSAYTALHHPDVFGNVVMHSPSCWMHPNLMETWATRNGDMTADPVGEPADIPLLIQEFQTAERVPIRIWHECGGVENGPAPARIWQTFGNRWLHDILQLKGYDTTYREYVGGHDHAWWRGTMAEGLIWVFDR
ncbi:MAG: alpha/beta hydrolase-fold protein [Thermomicrobiales bacterium]|nr:alpha/beta hydrolase-fold protein [Thermomicrobiales bacterium]